MKINRLIEIIIILLNKDIVTAKELSYKFNVSIRTIYRDIEELSLSGVPIFMSKGNGGGISLLEDYTFNKAIISEKDKEGLIVALKTLQATKYPEIDDTLNKLGSTFKKFNMEEWIEVDFSYWGDLKLDNRFDDIKIAILERKLISFRYVNSNSISINRTVEPHKLIFKSKEWYLWGFCKVRNDFRIFKINRIKNLELSNKSFVRRNNSLKIDDRKNVKLDVVNLKLRFNADVLYKIYDFYEEENIKKNDDGTYDVSVSYPKGQWVYDHILSYGSSVKVLEPNYIKEEIVNILNKTLELYK